MPGLLSLSQRPGKIEYLSQMVQTYIMKDIKGLVKEENVRAFNHLLFYLAEHQGNILPTSKLASEIGVTSKTVESYLEILEQTFIIYSVHSFAEKLSNELKKSRKYYFYDLGIRNSLMKNYPKAKYGHVIKTHLSSDIEVDGKIIKYRKVTEIYNEFRHKD